MAFTYTGGNGLFDALGAIAGGAQEEIDGITALQTRRNSIAGAYTAADYDQIAYTLSQLDARISERRNRLRDYQNDFQKTLIERMNDFNPLPQKTIYEAVKALAARMTADSYKVTANTLSAGAATAAAGNTGNGTVVIDLTDVLGAQYQYLPSGDLVLQCIQDAQLGDSKAVAVFQLTSDASKDGLDPEWPGGPGVAGSLIDITPQTSEERTGPNRNILAKSTFDTFTANVPDKWSLTAGSAGTEITSTATSSKGALAIKFISTGAPVDTKIEQTLNSSAASGSRGMVKPLTKYVFSFDVQDGASPPTGGSVRLSIKDGSNNILSSSTMKLSLSLSASPATYARQTSSANTPALIPSGVKAVLETITQNPAEDFFVDEALIAEMQRVPAGPFLSVIRGSTSFVIGDTITITLTNAWDGKFQKWFERFCGMRAMDLLLPTSGTTLISDGLVA